MKKVFCFGSNWILPQDNRRIPVLVSRLPTETSPYKNSNSSNDSSRKSSNRGSGMYILEACLLPREDAFRTHPENRLCVRIDRVSLSAIRCMFLDHCERSKNLNSDFLLRIKRALSILPIISRRVSSVVANTVSNTLNSTDLRNLGWSKASSIASLVKRFQKYIKRRNLNMASSLKVERTCQNDSLRLISEGEQFALHLKVMNLRFLPSPNFIEIQLEGLLGFLFSVRLMFLRNLEPHWNFYFPLGRYPYISLTLNNFHYVLQNPCIRRDYDNR
jgi:hypothetical protein